MKGIMIQYRQFFDVCGEERMKEKWRAVFALCCAAAVLLSGCSGSTDPKGRQDGGSKAEIRKMIPWKMGVLAVGTQGMCMEIQTDGSAEKLNVECEADLNDICTDGETIWIAGNGGTVLAGDESFSFHEENTGFTGDFTACSVFRDRVYSGGSDGNIFSSDGGGKWESCTLAASGNVTGMDASDDRCMAVTDAGEIAVTEDGDRWTVLNYGEYYKKPVKFQGLVYDGKNFWAYGTTKEGMGFFFSDTGSAWGERDVNYLEGEPNDLSGYRVLSAASDGQQLFAWCEGGVLLTLPDCVQCNKLTEIPEVQGGAVGYNGGSLFAASDDAHVKVLETELAKQYRVSGETAWQMQQKGAVLIDVRSEKERMEEGYIRDSICIPLDELEQKLPADCPDKSRTLVFYCTKGVRSQSAVEEALKLGYVEVYSMGSIDNWEHGLEDRH